MVLKQYVLQNLFYSHIRKMAQILIYILFIWLKVIIQFKTWAIVTSFGNFMNLTSVIYGHYILRDLRTLHSTDILWQLISQELVKYN